MRTRNFLVVAAVAAFPAFAPSAQAASGTFDCDHLQDALTNATQGDTITLDGVCGGGYTLPPFTSSDDYFPPITLTGTPGSGFDMEGDGRALTGVDSHRFEVTNLKFINGDVNVDDDNGPDGGAINVIGDTSLVVRDSLFQNNHADGNGGAIYDGQTDSPGLDLAGFAFSGNTFGSETDPDDGNTAEGNGGAVAVETSHGNGGSSLTSNTFANNEAWGNGGGFSIVQVDPPVVVERVSAQLAENGDNISLDDNTVTENSAEGSGGGGHVAMARNASLQITNNHFDDNAVEQVESEPLCQDHFGGGLFIEAGESNMFQHTNSFSDNEIDPINCGGDYGGGGEAIVGNGAKMHSENDAFLRNSVAGQEIIGTIQPESLSAQDEDPEEDESEGGGLFLSGTGALYHGFLNRVAGNAIGNGPNGSGAGAYAGALPNNEATLEFSDSTIAGNIIGFGGELAGLAGNGNDNLVLHNSIVWNPTQQLQTFATAQADTLNAPDIGGFDSIEVRFTDACQTEDATQPFPGDGNQCVDPKLNDPLNGDIHETATSPTIDNANDDLFFAEEEFPCCDFEGDPRPVDGDGDGHTADQGADESPAFVAPPTTGHQTPLTKPQCSDGIDNDGDGTVDSKDPGCLSGPNDTYDPSDNNEANETIKELVLCGRRNVSLVRADAKPGSKVRLSGLVATRFGGKKVKIFENLGNGWKKIATKKTSKNGTFKLTVVGPAADDFNKVRYQARIASSRSATLKLPQSLNSLSIKKQGANIVIKGRVKKSLLGSSPHAVVIRRLVCGHYVKVGKAMPDKNGRYTVKFKAPRLGTAALYRAETRVLARPASTKYVKQYARGIGIKLTGQTG